MHDPHEGVTPLGMIETGASRDRVPAPFEPVLGAAVTAVRAAARDASLYLYGSIATRTAEAGRSDVDLLTMELPPADAAAIAQALDGVVAHLVSSFETMIGLWDPESGS
jgi:predicted nucleotidyltransferase